MEGNATLLKNNGKKLWQAIVDEGKMAQQLATDELREIHREFMTEKLPAVLDDLADLPATGDNVIRAMIAYAQHILDDGLSRRIADAATEEMLMFFSADGLCEIAVEAMETAVEQLGQLVEDYDGFLAAQGVTDEQMLMHFGMRADNARKAQTGELTIGGLLLAQPSVITVLNKN